MPRLEIIVPHRLMQAEANRRIRSLLNNMKTRHADKIENYHEEWDGDSGNVRFSAMGFTVSAKLEVKKSQVEINGDLPFAAVFLEGKIKTAIEDNMKILLA